MKNIFPLYFFFFSMTIARADLSVKMGFTGQSPTNILMSIVDRIKGNKSRVDAFFEGANLGSKILNLDTGEGFKLLPDQKIAVKTALDPSVQTNSIPIDTIEDTGKTQMVNGYDAEIYTYTNLAFSYTLWIAKDFPNFETIKQDLVKRDRLHVATQSGFFHLSTLPGMLLKCRLENAAKNAGGYIPQFQVLINEDPIDESIFEVPKDYTWQKPSSVTNTNAPVANTNEVISATNKPPIK